MRNVKAILALGLAAVIGVTATGCGKRLRQQMIVQKIQRKRLPSQQQQEEVQNHIFT